LKGFAMTTDSNGHSLSRATTFLLAGLMVLSTVLFVAGVALERSGSGSGAATAPVSQTAATSVVGAAAPEGSAAGEAQEGQLGAATAAPEGSAAREAQEQQPAAGSAAPQSAEGTATHEQGEQNRVFGIDVESPGVIAGVVLGTLLLIAGLFVFGYRVLPLLFIVALGATVLDAREVVYQFGQAQYGVTLLAIGVTLSRLATVLVSGLAWRAGRRQLAPMAAP
jgi:hypothetical protein